MYKHLLFFFLIILNVSLFSQDDGEGSDKFCNDDISKKALEFYAKGIDKKKNKKPERLQFLMKALEIEPDFAEANLAMGFELVARAVLENSHFTGAVPFLQKAIAVCPQIHSAPYYYIGYDYYDRLLKNDSAVKYLQKFINFKDGDAKKFSKDWESQMYNAKMMVKSAKKESSLKKNVQFDPKVIRGVSTERDEYLAYISPDDKSCYFVRKLPMNNKNQVYASDKEKEWFMVATRDKTNTFNEGEPMSAPFNATDDNQGGCSISIDNRSLYFAMSRFEGGSQPNVDIYVSDFADGGWSEIRKLSANVNHPVYWDSQPTIASDGSTMYFASDRPGGLGGIDLYVTKKDQKTGQWSLPQNLGPNINTRGNEKTPFIHSDSETLYFSSDGHFGFGGYDIFYVKKNEKGQWEEPENIGSPINGGGDDTGFFVSTDTKTGYFFSFDEGKVRGRGVGRYDLYGFELYKEARPQQVTLVRGSVTDSSGAQVSGAVVEVKDIKTKQTSFATVDSASGEYMVAVRKKNDVILTVKKDNIAFNTKTVKVAELPEAIMDVKVIKIEVKEARAGSSFVIDNIQYNTSSAEIMDDSRIFLESFATYLKENPSILVEIQGHTDNVGNAKDNDALSTNRAFSVKTALEEYGVEGKRIKARGFGASKPIAANTTEAGRAKNRRTEFYILEK